MTTTEDLGCFWLCLFCGIFNILWQSPITFSFKLQFLEPTKFLVSRTVIMILSSWEVQNSTVTFLTFSSHEKNIWKVKVRGRAWPRLCIRQFRLQFVLKLLCPGCEILDKSLDLWELGCLAVNNDKCFLLHKLAQKSSVSIKLVSFLFLSRSKNMGNTSLTFH